MDPYPVEPSCVVGGLEACIIAAEIQNLPFVVWEW